MKFYIFHRPLYSTQSKEFIGDMLHISLEDKEYAPDGHKWKKRTCKRPEEVYTRLVAMLKRGGMSDDMVYPLDGKRTIKDIVNYMNTWA